MKIMIIGSNYFSYMEHLSSCFEEMGHVCLWLEYTLPRGGIKNFLYYGMPAQLESIFKLNSYDKKYIEYKKLFNNNIIEQSLSFKPDLVFIVRGEFMFPETIKALKELGSQVHLWMYDSIRLYNGVEPYLGYLDVYYSYEPTDVDYVKKGFNNNSFYLPLGYNHKKYVFIKDCNKNNDLFFIGALHQNRISFLNNLCKKYSDRRIKIHTNYIARDRFWRKPFLKILFPDLARYIYPPIYSHEKINEEYNKTKININIHNTSYGFEQGLNYRFFELLGSGSFQIVEKKYLQKIEMPVGAGVVSYESVQELFEQIDYYLDNDNGRERLIEKGLYFAKNHTIKKRMEFVLEKYSSLI